MEVVGQQAAGKVATLEEARALIATLGAELKRLAEENAARRQRRDKLCQRFFGRPSEKGRPEPGLPAHVVTSQYADHLPLYRQEPIFLRHGVEVTRRTLAEWNGALADLVPPIVRSGMKEQLLGSPRSQCDDVRDVRCVFR